MSDSALSLLTQALDNGRVDVLSSLLNEISSKSEFHDIIDTPLDADGTLLHRAVKRCNLDATRTLLTHGSNPCIRNSSGATATQLALTGGSDVIIGVFRQELFTSVSHSKLSRVCQLLSSGVPIDCIDDQLLANTPLHYAATYGSADIVRVLLEGGAPSHVQNRQGDTPLHDAVTRNAVDIVRLLLAHGASPTVKNANGKDCAQLAESKPEILQIISAQSVQNMVRKRTPSTESLTSLASTTKLNQSNGSVPRFNHVQKTFFSNILDPVNSSEPWHQLLWPPPQNLIVKDGFRVLQNSVLAIRLGPRARASAQWRDILQLCNVFTHLFGQAKIVLDVNSLFEPAVLPPAIPPTNIMTVECTPDAFNSEEGYTIDVDERRTFRVNCGGFPAFRNALITLAQISLLFEHQRRASATQTSPSSPKNTALTPPSPKKPIGLRNSKPEEHFAVLPTFTCRDWPVVRFRATLLQMNAFRCFTVDSVNRILGALVLVKYNVCFLDYTVAFRPERAGALSLQIGGARDFLTLQTAAKNLGILLALSIDSDVELNNEVYVDPFVMLNSICDTLEQFGAEKRFLRIGPKLTKWLAAQEKILVRLEGVVDLLWMTFSTIEQAALYQPLPSFCVICISADQVKSTSALNEFSEFCNECSEPYCFSINASSSTSLCKSPDDLFKTSIILSKLLQKTRPIAILSCDISVPIGGQRGPICNIQLPSFTYAPHFALAGVAWNNAFDIRPVAGNLCLVTAWFAFRSETMEPLVRQMLLLSNVDFQLSTLRHASMHLPPASPHSTSPSTGFNVDVDCSVLLSLLRDPDNVDLDGFNALVFKKAKIEVSKSLASLNQLKSELPYNFELALALTEVQLMGEVMMLACKIGQFLCMAGANPKQNSGGAEVVNFGIGHLNLTTRTDLTNKVLELRAKMQHIWLSRHIAETLPSGQMLLTKLVELLIPSGTKIEHDEN